METWKDVVGYEGLYQVSDMGRVKRLPKKVRCKGNSYMILPENILNGSFDKDGYIKVTLTKDGEQKSYRVHRLVALAFLPNSNNYPQINHKDENKANNCLSNIEWCSCSYNINYGTRNDRVGSKARISKEKRGRGFYNVTSYPKRKVAQYDLSGNLIRIWDSLADAEREIGAHHSSVVANCQGKRNMVNGYKWAYVDP